MYTDSIVYYNLNGIVLHNNYYEYKYLPGYSCNEYATSFIKTLYPYITESSNNPISVSVFNKSVSCNLLINYTDGFKVNTSRVQDKNSIYDYLLIFNEDSIGQKQVNIGNNISSFKIVSEKVNITGDVVVNQDITVNNMRLNENIIMSETSKLGIGKTPEYTLDIVGNQVITGNIGIGTSLQFSKLDINSINENSLLINNTNIIGFPLQGFYNLYSVTTTGVKKLSIDNKFDVKLYPPPIGANYGSTCIASASSLNGPYIADNAFDKNYTNFWQCATSKYLVNGQPAAGAASTVVSSVTYNGEWLQILLPKNISLIYYRIYKGTVDTAFSPKSWIIAGSMDGSTWSLVDSRPAYQPPPVTYNEYSVNSSIQYKYYRMIITSIIGNNINITSVKVCELELYLNNVNTAFYEEFKYNTVNYKANANTIYNYYYNDSNLYLPNNLLDQQNPNIWRTSNLYDSTLNTCNVAYIELDIINALTINSYTLIGNSLVTYPKKFTLEGFSGGIWNTIDVNNLNSISSLTNTYLTSNNSINTSQYRFSFSNNFATLNEKKSIELSKIRFNKQNTLTLLNINSNNDIYMKGNININGNIYSTDTIIPALKITPNQYHNALEVYTKNNNMGFVINNNGSVGIGTTIITNTNAAGALHIFGSAGVDTNGNSAQLIVEHSSTNIGGSDNDARIIIKAKQTGESELICYTDDNGVIQWGKFGMSSSGNIYIQRGSSGIINSGTSVFQINTSTAYFNAANVGISTTIPYAALDIRGRTGVAVTGDKQLYIGHYTTENYGWYIGNQTATPTTVNNDLYFAVNRGGTVTDEGFIQDSAVNLQMNFTGQHKCFVQNTSYSNLLNYEGLIVSANQNKYVRMSSGIACGKEAITISESLPIVTLTSNAYDKTIFGVVSTVEDPDKRTEAYGIFVTIFNKEKGDTRAYINSVGEGAIWVSDINGSLQSGDYITSSSILGYGMKQSDDILHNYTVAKITMDCDFNPLTIPKLTLKKNTIINIDGSSNITNELDTNGNIIWTEKIDENNNIVYETEYEIRYINQNGSIINKEEYDTLLLNNSAYKAAFVGCTYHCG